MRRLRATTAVAALVALGISFLSPTAAVASPKKYKPVHGVTATRSDFGTSYRRSLHIQDTGVADTADYCLTFNSHKFFTGSALVLTYQGRKVAARRFVDAGNVSLNRYVKGSICYPVPRTTSDAKKLRKLGYHPLARGHVYTFQIYVAGNGDFKRYYRTLTFRVPKG